MGRFPVKQTSDGRYMFNLIANNNRVISSSQTHASIANAKVGIESVRTNCAAPVEDQTVEGFEVLKHPKYEVYLDVGGKPRFRLRGVLPHDLRRSLDSRSALWSAHASDRLHV